MAAFACRHYLEFDLPCTLHHPDELGVCTSTLAGLRANPTKVETGCSDPSEFQYVGAFVQDDARQGEQRFASPFACTDETETRERPTDRRERQLHAAASRVRRESHRGKTVMIMIYSLRIFYCSILSEMLKAPSTDFPFDASFSERCDSDASCRQHCTK